MHQGLVVEEVSSEMPLEDRRFKTEESTTSNKHDSRIKLRLQQQRVPSLPLQASQEDLTSQELKSEVLLRPSQQLLIVWLEVRA